MALSIGTISIILPSNTPPFLLVISAQNLRASTRSFPTEAYGPDKGSIEAILIGPFVSFFSQAVKKIIPKYSR